MATAYKQLHIHYKSERHTASDERRATNDEGRTTSDERLATSDKRRRTDYRRTTSDERRATIDERRATDDEQRTIHKTNKRKQTNELQHQDMFLIDGDTRTSIKSIVIGYGWGVTGRVDIDAR